MPRAFNVKRAHGELASLLRPIDLESAVLFCNHVLAAWRREACDPLLENLVDELRMQCFPFFIHLATRQVLLHSLGPSNHPMRTDEFKRLIGLLRNLLDHDPAIEEPGWRDSDVTGWAIRYVGLQQNQFPMPKQLYGLSVGLFTNAIPVSPDEKVDIPDQIQQTLGMHPLVFMRAGFAASAVAGATSGSVRLAGTCNTATIRETNASVIGEGVTENWDRFIELVACTRARFKEESRMHEADARYELYRFNVLKRRPLVDLDGLRFVAVDRLLMVTRTTLGMYYDLLERYGDKFTQPFGHRLANLVGLLTRGACGPDRVWSESGLPKNVREKPPSRNADHAFIGDSTLVLFECKGLTPNARLLMLGELSDAETIVSRITDAVRQLTLHANAIRSGAWTSHGLPARECCGLVVTFGEIPTVNGGLFRRKVEKALKGEGLNPLPYLVLSLCQFDSLIRAVEHGRPLETAATMLCKNPHHGFPGPLESELSTDAISTMTRDWGQAVLDSIPGVAPDESPK